MAEQTWSTPIAEVPPAPDVDRTRLTFTVNTADVQAVEARSAYAEMFWLPVIGPSSLWLLRRIELTATVRPWSIDRTELGALFGLSGTGKHSPLTRTLVRLHGFYLLRPLDHREVVRATAFLVRCGLPLLTRKQVERLPGGLQMAHAKFLERWEGA